MLVCMFSIDFQTAGQIAMKFGTEVALVTHYEGEFTKSKL